MGGQNFVESTTNSDFNKNSPLLSQANIFHGKRDEHQCRFESYKHADSSSKAERTCKIIHALKRAEKSWKNLYGDDFFWF